MAVEKNTQEAAKCGTVLIEFGEIGIDVMTNLVFLCISLCLGCAMMNGWSAAT